MNRKSGQYIPGLGRGAVGFTTRSDIGPATPATPSGDASGSRAAEARAALKKNHQQGLFGWAPDDYVPGAGRGAGRLSKEGDEGGPTGAYDPFSGYGNAPVPDENQFDEEDDEADRVWVKIDERMNSRRRKRKNLDENDETEDEGNTSRLSQIGSQFRELKEKLADVTEVEWASIPDVGDHSLKFKQNRRQQDHITPLTDSLLDQRNKANKVVSSQVSSTAIAYEGISSTTTNMAGLSAARNTVLGMSLDKMSDSATSRSVIDRTGYLTSLSSNKVNEADIGDINKARLLLKSVRETNPRHAPGWIAAARVEEAAGKTLHARKIIQEGCEICPDNEDIWLEAARLHPPEVGKSILATAARRMPNSVKIFLKAADMEHNVMHKKSILRKALESNSSSVSLWKAAIELEDADNARLLLSVAVEKIPKSLEMWLALARLESYENSRKVLNKARKALPGERAIWIAAAKLEEAQLLSVCDSANKRLEVIDLIDSIIARAVKSLEKQNIEISRIQWLQEAEQSELSGSPLTCNSIIRHTVGKNVEAEDRQRTWIDDAKSMMQKALVVTARAVIEFALATFPTKKSFWTLAVELETKYGDKKSLDDVLSAASKRLPSVEIFWLLRAKEKWLAGNLDEARMILTDAFAANPDSEAVWLAAAKLEWENSEIERARVLLNRARERAPTARVYMKSALLEREQKKFGEAIRLIEEGITLYPTFAKFYMMGGQIYSNELSDHSKALLFYQRGIQNCVDCVVLSILASRLEERINEPKLESGPTRARSVLEIARLNNPSNPQLWLESIRLERRNGSHKLANTLMAKALQDCPNSGLLLAESIHTAPRVEKKSKAADAIKRCPDDPHVIAAVAALFASERKVDKARKWFNRAVILDPDNGDNWAAFYTFERELGGDTDRKQVVQRCAALPPRHGELWSAITKDLSNRGKPIAELLSITSNAILQRRDEMGNV